MKGKTKISENKKRCNILFSRHCISGSKLEGGGNIRQDKINRLQLGILARSFLVDVIGVSQFTITGRLGPICACDSGNDCKLEVICR